MKLSKKVLLAVSVILVSSILIGIIIFSNQNPAQEYNEQTKAKLGLYNTELDSLKRLIHESPENKTLKNLLIKKYYAYDLAIATANNVRPGNEPYLFLNENSDKTIILVHGLTGSPWETKELGKFLFIHNFTVYGVRLYAHGTNVDQLYYSEWHQWYASVEDAYTNLRYYSPNIYIGGVSTGAALSLMLAENNPEIKGVVSIAAPIYLNSKKSMFAILLKYFMAYSPRNLTEEEKSYYYDKHVVAAVEELYKAIEVYRKNLNEIKQPVLIMQATNDTTVFPISAEIINKNLGSSNKTLIWYNETKHVLTKSSIKENVFNDVLAFLHSN
ncbi:TPA: prolyl oligopeptidase family serine peptidase [Candidatus Woesearchaeota archaeon]|nr:prolyl oligopeptidase family serine peptidase [Candidatus Woesearchaeota archaeon]